MAGFGMFAMQMDGIEGAFGGTDTASYTPVLIHDGRTATEATCCLAAHLFFGKRLMVVGKRITLGFHTRVLTVAVVIGLDDNLGFVEFDEVTTVTTDGHMAVLHEPME